MPEPWEEFTDEIDEEKFEMFMDIKDSDEEEVREMLAREAWVEQASPVEILEAHDSVLDVIEDTPRSHNLWVKTVFEAEKAMDIGGITDTIDWIMLRSTITNDADLEVTNTREYEGHFTVTVR